MKKLDLNAPSFFRAGGIPVLGADQRVTAGTQDGTPYIHITGRHEAKAFFTPKQYFDLAVGMLETLGYRLDLGKGPQDG